MQAMRLGRSDTSKVSIFLAPLSLPRMRFQVGSTPHASGDTMPRPVTATRLISRTPARSFAVPQQEAGGPRSGPVRLQRHRAGSSALRVLLEEFGGVANRQNRLRRIIGNFAAEFFFERHHQFDRVKTVGAEVIDEARIVDHLLRLDTEVFDHDLLNPLANLAHRSTSCCSIRPDARLGHPGRVNSLVPVAVAHFPDLAPVVADGARRTTAGSASPIYRVSTSCNGVLCHAVRGCG